jgi:hypothetical protein
MTYPTAAAQSAPVRQALQWPIRDIPPRAARCLKGSGVQARILQFLTTANCCVYSLTLSIVDATESALNDIEVERSGPNLDSARKQRMQARADIILA